MRLALLVYKYFPYGGMQRDFLRIALALQGLGHHCRVYCLSWQGEVPSGLEIRRVPVRAVTSQGRGRRFSRWVQADLAVDPVDGVVGFNKMPGLDVYFAADPCYLDKALTGRGWWYRLGGRYRHFAKYERAVFGTQSDTHILLISDRGRDSFQRHYHTPPTRLSLLPPGVSPDRRPGSGGAKCRVATRSALGVSEEALLLLFLGSGFETKGLDRAIRALGSLRGSRAVHLLVVGQDKPRSFQRMSRRLGLGDAVHFLGGRDDVPDLLLAADLLVHPARAEAGGIVLLEALVAGLPVITTDVCGYAHHVQEAGAGTVLGSPFRQLALEQAVQRGLDEAWREDCRERALQYASVTDLYSMHATGAGIIESVIERKLERSLDSSR